MKKILFIMFAFCLGVIDSYADRHEEDPNNTIYSSEVSVTSGGQATLTVSMKNSVEIGGFEFDLYLPEGFTVDHSINSFGDVAINASLIEKRTDLSRHTFQASFPSKDDHSHIKVLCYSSASKSFLDNDGAVATIVVNVAESVEEGDYTVDYKNVVISNATDTYATAKVTSTVSVENGNMEKRAEDVNLLPSKYAVEIIPQSIERGETFLKVYIKAETGVKFLSFDVELPKGMYLVDEAEWDKANVNYTYNTNAFTGVPGTQIATLEDGDFPTIMNFKVEGTYTNKSKKYITETNELAELVEFGPVYIATEEDEEENDWASNGTVMPSVGENIVKITNINITTINGVEMTGHEYYATFTYGKIDSLDPIIYGDYTSSEALAVLKEVLPENATSIDLTAAIINKKPELKNPNAIVYVSSDIEGDNVVKDGKCNNLVLEDGKSFNVPTKFIADNASYSRAMTNQWGTIMLPYEVESNNEVAYYLPSSIEDGTLKLTKQETLPANTPALVSKLSGEGIAPVNTNVKVSSKDGNTHATGNVVMHGSFTNDTKVNDPNAYYIKSNKFWLCNEYFFIDAFRAYFTVESASAKSLSIDVDDVVDSINALVGVGDTTIEGYYDVTGKRLTNLQNGLNIVKFSNGKTKKIIVE